MGLGGFWGILEDGFGRGWGRLDEVENLTFFKNVWECFSQVGKARNSMLSTKIEGKC